MAKKASLTLLTCCDKHFLLSYSCVLPPLFLSAGFQCVLEREHFSCEGWVFVCLLTVITRKSLDKKNKKYSLKPQQKWKQNPCSKISATLLYLGLSSWLIFAQQMSLPSLPLEVSVCYSAMLCCVCMRSRVNRFNYPNKTGGRCNKAAEKKRKEKEKRALCAAGGEIYAWLHLHQWRHKCEKNALA